MQEIQNIQYSITTGEVPTENIVMVSIENDALLLHVDVDVGILAILVTILQTELIERSVRMSPEQQQRIAKAAIQAAEAVYSRRNNLTNEEANHESYRSKITCSRAGKPMS